MEPQVQADEETAALVRGGCGLAGLHAVRWPAARASAR